MRKFTVGKRYNSAVIQVSRQTYVKVYDAEGIVLFSDESVTREVKPLLSPGEYVVETDGTVKSIRAAKHGGLDDLKRPKRST